MGPVSLRTTLTIGVFVAMFAARDADARVVRGVVFEDRDGDGRHGADEPIVPGVAVAFDTAAFASADADGAFALTVPERATGVIWASVPDGFRPGPAFARVLPNTTTVSIPLVPAPPRVGGPLVFVLAADTHEKGDQPFALDLAAVLDRATAREPRPDFVTILGDITQGNQPREFALADAGTQPTGVPFVPVAGNHDFYFGGEEWFAHYGPDNYSFAIAGVHVVVWNMALDDDAVLAFLTADLERVDRAATPTTIAFAHAPPSPAVLARLRALHVDAVFTGHVHANVAFERDGLRTYAQEPLLMGGLDGTPAGYRVVTIGPGTGARAIASEHHFTEDAARVAILAPRGDRCVRAGEPIVVAATPARVSAALDCGAPIELAYAGGSIYRAAIPAGLAPGRHALVLDARGAERATAAATIAICEPSVDARAATAGASWPMLGGEAGHAHARARELAPPLVEAWTQPAGGHVLHASPIVGGGAVFVPVVDLADGDAGGVTALDLATGAPRWRRATRAPIRGGLAYARDTIVAGLANGDVVALDAATGAPRWTTSLADGVRAEAAGIFGAPIVVDGTDVMIANQHRLAALDLATGVLRWSVDPLPREPFDFATTGALASAGGLVLGTQTRALGGIAAVERETGARVWRFEGLEATGVNASPAIDRDHELVFVPNGADEITALELATGAVRWSDWLDETGFEWGEATPGTPAYARGVVVVPTLYDAVVGIAAASGLELWRAQASGPSPLRTTHYRGRGERGFAAAPVIAGSIVYTIDTRGELVARELERGTALWRTELGAPVLATPALAGDALVVATVDGSVHLLVRGDVAPPAPPPTACEAGAPPGGCCAIGGARGDGVFAIAIALALARRRRVRTCAR